MERERERERKREWRLVYQQLHAESQMTAFPGFASNSSQPCLHIAYPATCMQSGRERQRKREGGREGGEGGRDRESATESTHQHTHINTHTHTDTLEHLNLS
jgi:hypothetical protein